MNRLASPQPRSAAAISRDILLLLDEAHAALPAECLDDFLREVRAALRASTAHAPDGAPNGRMGAVPATRVSLRAIERLLADRRRSAGPPDAAWVADFERHLDDLASRPRGATLSQASA